MGKKGRLTLLLTLSGALALSAAAAAFDDLPEGAARAKIMSLKERGIVSGDGSGAAFHGSRALSNAEAVQLLVKGFDLNLNAFLFIKKPEASDSFDHVPNDAWYAPAFVVAIVNGLELPRSIDPQGMMTRETFAHLLLGALLVKGDYSFTKMIVPVADDAQVSAGYRHSLQLLLNGRIAELDADGRFRPQEAITRSDAAVMVYNALAFMQQQGAAADEQPPADGQAVTLTSEPVSEAVNKVTLAWGEQPNAGYAIKVTRVVFGADDQATVYYRLVYPDPDTMYAQVVTKPRAEVFIGSAYKPVLRAEEPDGAKAQDGGA